MASNYLGATISSPAELRVVYPQQLREPIRLENGRIRISFGDSDGGAITTERLPRFEIQTATSLAPNTWLRLTNTLVLTNGMLRLEHDGGTEIKRFYRVIER